MTLRAAVFASGSGSNFEVLADYPRGGRAGGSEQETGPTSSPDPLWEVILLVTDREQAPVLERAHLRGIPTAVVAPEANAESFAHRLLAILQEARPDILLLAGYLRLIPASVVQRYRGRMLNVHPALLPGFGGAGMYGRRVHQAVLSSGARVSGASVHFVDEEYDRGRVLAQWPVPVLPDDTPESLAGRIQEVEHLLYPAAVQSLARGLIDGVDPVPIPAAGRHFHLLSTLPELP